MTWFDSTRALISDTECYPNLWSIGFRRVEDGKTLVMRLAEGYELNRDRLRNLMMTNTMIGYNFIGYDAIMIALAIAGATNAELKRANDTIIMGGMKYWEAERVLGVRVPRDWAVIDLMEPQPNAFASLKTLQGRMHGRKMQDLPYSPDQRLTDGQIEDVISYMANDLEATHGLFDHLREALDLRHALGVEYAQNFLSKSDSQIGEAIAKKRVEQLTGDRVDKIETPAGTSFRYNIPTYMNFEHADLAAILEKLRVTDFYVQANGKVDLPKWLDGRTVTIGHTTYAMGIGGLHSTEANRALHSDDDVVLIDFDAISFYPNIILNSGLYPRSLGPRFLEVYRRIVEERIAAKRAGNKVTAEGLKIALNGQFGKLGSKYSVLYAPHLMIAVTITGQLSLLMLIERAEAAGIPVVSANTDGVVFHCPRDREPDLQAITKQWEVDTGFELEQTRYRSLYSASVNSYIAIKEDGKAKIKGPVGNPWREGDKRGQLMKNPQATVLSRAVVDFLTDGVPIEQTIRQCQDTREFVTVVNVKGGGTWNGEYLGKVVRYYWALGGAEILYKEPHPSTGNFKKVSKSDGCRPLMELPDALPSDIDYDRYIAEAYEILMDIGYTRRPDPVKPLRIFKRDAPLWFAVAV